jgi:hypothetical protein
MKIRIKIRSRSRNSLPLNRCFSRGRGGLFRHSLLEGEKRFRLDVQEPDAAGLESKEMRLGCLQRALVMTHATDDTASSLNNTKDLLILVTFPAGL